MKINLGVKAAVAQLARYETKNLSKKKGLTTSSLPEAKLRFQLHPFIRILRVLGGLSFFVFLFIPLYYCYYVLLYH